MKAICLLLVLAVPMAALAADNAPASRSAPAGKNYELGPDSVRQEGVPQGKLEGPLVFRSQVITNTTRHYWIYVPAQYYAGQTGLRAGVSRRPTRHAPQWVPARATSDG